MSTANVFIAISDTALTTLKPLLSDYEYDGPHLEAVKIFRKMTDRAVVQRMFKTPTIGGKKWILFSIYLNGSAKAKEAIDYLAENYETHIVVLGAWWFDGLQVGTRIEDGEIVGTPMYPIHAQLIKFMPDIIERDEDGNVTSTTPATELTDINILQGQTPRHFS